MSSDAILSAARLKDRGLEWDEILSALRNEGVSKIGAIRATATLLDLSLGDAKRLVHDSAAWNDQRERDNVFHEELITELAPSHFSEAWVPERYRAFAATSRPVTLRDGTQVAFSREALESFAAQVASQFVPMNIEHLDVLPPVGRWRSGHIVEASDGELDLYLDGEQLRTLVPAGDDPDFFSVLSDAPLATSEATTIKPVLRIRRSNFSPSGLTRVTSTAPLELEVQDAWSEVPPIVWTLAVPVLWGATRFVGSFLDALGAEAGKKLLSWLRSRTHDALDPDRDQLLRISFEITPDSELSAFITLPAGSLSPDAIAQFESVSEVGDLAGMQRVQKFLPNLKRAACFFDGTSWRLAWWTDGENVYATHWFLTNEPDTTRLLGRPMLLPEKP